MDHPLPAPDALVRPWRNAAYIAGAIALVELLLLVVIGGGQLAHAVSHRVQRAATNQAATSATPATRHAATKTAQVARARLSRSHTKVLVLNGNGRTGAAGTAATRIRHRGYQISGVSNAPREVARTIVMYRPGFVGEGRRLGRDLGVRLVGPLDGLRIRQLHGAEIVVILGR